MPERPDPGLSVTLDAVDEARLRRLAVRVGLTPDQMAARLIAERLDAVAEQALPGEPLDGDEDVSGALH